MYVVKNEVVKSPRKEWVCSLCQCTQDAGIPYRKKTRKYHHSDGRPCYTESKTCLQAQDFPNKTPQLCDAATIHIPQKLMFQLTEMIANLPSQCDRANIDVKYVPVISEILMRLSTSGKMPDLYIDSQNNRMEIIHVWNKYADMTIFVENDKMFYEVHEQVRLVEKKDLQPTALAQINLLLRTYKNLGE